MTASLSDPTPQHGFSLLELSIVLIVFGLLASGMIGAITSQRSLADERKALQLLDLAIDTLYGFAIRHGRLPCPAAANLTNSDSNAGIEACPLEHGVLPWRTLGLAELDPWGQRLSYYADRDFSGEPIAGARAAFGLETPGSANVHAAHDITATIANTLPAIVVSHGPNGHLGYRSNGGQNAGGSPDEAENADRDSDFIDHLPNPGYDDLIRWLPPDLLAMRMLVAGRLP